MGFRLLRWALALAAALSLVTACGGDGPTDPSGGGGGGSVPNIAGIYNYESDATLMSCTGGTTIPLPFVSDVLTITQSGNRFSGELDIASTIATPTGASFFDECIINTDSTYTCTGEYRDSNAVITFNGGGRFTGNSFQGTINLRMTLADGTVCTWTKSERGTKVS